MNFQLNTDDFLDIVYLFGLTYYYFMEGRFNLVIIVVVFSICIYQLCHCFSAN